jgi:hypothetical protein
MKSILCSLLESECVLQDHPNLRLVFTLDLRFLPLRHTEEKGESHENPVSELSFPTSQALVIGDDTRS